MTKAKAKSAKGKKAVETDTRKPKHGHDPNRPSKGSKGMRDAATVRRLNMYKTRPIRDKKGHLLYEEYQGTELPKTRIQPDRRWFGNTRVIGQKQLEEFRSEMSTKVNDAYTVLLKEKKLPLQLLEDPEKKLAGKVVRSNLLTTQPFSGTFGPQRTRKRPRLAVDSMADLAQLAGDKEDKYEEQAVVGPTNELDIMRAGQRESVFGKGTSKRIWGELYKVLDSSDVVIQVLDARDPNGTRCFFLEQHIRKHLRHKHLILLLNKCDLVPAWVTKRWLHHLSREFPTLAFHASITNPFGKGALLSLLRQLARLRSDKQAISVGFVGYPNVGKSSVINTLRTKKVCKAAPIPGETKVWQYITLMKRIFCIDCPGVVYNKTQGSESDLVLKGVVRVEMLEDATHHVQPVLERVKPEYLRRAYKIREWTDTEDFLTQLARLSGKLLKGGDPDLNTAARMVLYDWQRGKIPFFTLPPGHTEEKPVAAAAKAEGQGEAPEGAAVTVVDVEAEAADLPLPSEAVTEEDAAREAGARPEAAAAAARAVRDVLLSAAAAQTRMAIPVQSDYFTAEDERRDENAGDADVVSDADEDDDDSPSGSGDADEDGDAEPEVSGDEEPEPGFFNKDDEAGSSGQDDADQSADQDDDDDQGDRGRQASGRGAGTRGGRQAKGRGGKKAVAAADEDEDTGYGAGGLSWEAVLACVKGGDDETEAIPAIQDPVQPARKKSKAAAEPKVSREVKQRQKQKTYRANAKTLE